MLSPAKLLFLLSPTKFCLNFFLLLPAKFLFLLLPTKFCLEVPLCDADKNAIGCEVPLLAVADKVLP